MKLYSSILLIFIFLIGITTSCSKPKYKTRNGGKRIISIKESGHKQYKYKR